MLRKSPLLRRRQLGSGRHSEPRRRRSPRAGPPMPLIHDLDTVLTRPTAPIATSRRNPALTAGLADPGERANPIPVRGPDHPVVELVEERHTMKFGWSLLALGTALLTTDASAQGINLTGPYRCVALCRDGQVGQPAFVTQN